MPGRRGCKGHTMRYVVTSVVVTSAVSSTGRCPMISTQ